MSEIMVLVKIFSKTQAKNVNSIKNRMGSRQSALPGFAMLLAFCLAIGNAVGGDGGVNEAGNKEQPGFGELFADEDIARVDLITAQTAIGKSHSHDNPAMVMAGLRFRLAPGWKTYWRSPGDAGYPPMVDWSQSDNLAKTTLWWPSPKRYFDHGLQTIGYENEVILPLSIEVKNPAIPLSVQAMVDYLVCEEICIPLQQNISLIVPPGPSEPTPEARLIDRYRAAVPVVGNPDNPKIPSITIQELTRDQTTDSVRLRAIARSPNRFHQPDLFLEGAEGTWFSQPKTTVSQSSHQVQFTFTAGGVASFIDANVTATLVDGKQAWERDIIVNASATRAPMDTQTGLAAILVLAFLGGLILNLMPCVLPVLSLKILSVIDHTDGVPPRIRFLATASGIITSFLVLALALILLQAGGQRIGWGIQFQQPVFLAVMAVIITVFACNLWGWLTISAPHYILNRLPAGKQEQGWPGHFATGAFATLLATPCSAPFLGTAVGFALAGHAGDILAVFITLGVGFSTPYLLLAFFPAIARWLPKPGAWMNRLKAILGFLLAATALWLVTVISAQSGILAAVSTGIFLIGLIMGLALAADTVVVKKKQPNLMRRSGYWLATLCGIAAIITTASLQEHQNRATNAIDEGQARQWHSFDPVWLDEQVDAGRTVLVDVTADWCLTCQVNKHLVLEDPAIEALIEQGDIFPMRADWTRPDPVISDYLATYGRYGIPFNRVYGPGALSGITLPEVLTLHALNTALDQASIPAAPGSPTGLPTDP